MIRCIAIDDEPLALQQVSRYVKRIPGLELLGTFYSTEDAMDIISGGSVDLIFLDIDMPDCNGVDFARNLGPHAPQVVFTTAYPQYAPDGFRLDAVDYLLKPLSFSEMLEAVGKVERRLREQAAAPAPESYLYVKSGGSLIRVLRSGILYVKGMGEYVQIKIEGTPGHVVTLESMHKFEELLQDAGFIRIHRSYIVNPAHIDKASSNQVMIAGEIIPVGEKYRTNFKELYLNEKS